MEACRILCSLTEFVKRCIPIYYNHSNGNQLCSPSRLLLVCSWLHIVLSCENKRKLDWSFGFSKFVDYGDRIILKSGVIIVTFFATKKNIGIEFFPNLTPLSLKMVRDRKNLLTYFWKPSVRRIKWKNAIKIWRKLIFFHIPQNDTKYLFVQF